MALESEFHLIERGDCLDISADGDTVTVRKIEAVTGKKTKQFPYTVH
jgi:hypothetical protein